MWNFSMKRYKTKRTTG